MRRALIIAVQLVVLCALLFGILKLSELWFPDSWVSIPFAGLLSGLSVYATVKVFQRFEQPNA